MTIKYLIASKGDGNIFMFTLIVLLEAALSQKVRRKMNVQPTSVTSVVIRTSHRLPEYDPSSGCMAFPPDNTLEMRFLP